MLAKKEVMVKEIKIQEIKNMLFILMDKKKI